jgi:hypothetical protein
LLPQSVPSGSEVVAQPPVPSHDDVAWHAEGTQAYAVPPHAPPLQTSPAVQATPSLQPVPDGAAGFEQAPVDGLHVPATWHWSWAVHVTGFVPVHVPPLH